MYGNDWIMLGREPGYQSYAATLGAEMSRIVNDPARLNNFLGGNALRYLGLREGEPTRRRLDAYYARHKMDSTWLAQIDKLH